MIKYTVLVILAVLLLMLMGLFVRDLREARKEFIIGCAIVVAALAAIALIGWGLSILDPLNIL